MEFCDDNCPEDCKIHEFLKEIILEQTDSQGNIIKNINNQSDSMGMD